MSPESKEKAAVALFLAKKAFHWGFIPTVLYLGFKKGNDPGMPELSLLSQQWKKRTNQRIVARARVEHEHNLRGGNEPAVDDDDVAQANADDASFLYKGDLA